MRVNEANTQLFVYTVCSMCKDLAKFGENNNKKFIANCVYGVDGIWRKIGDK